MNVLPYVFLVEMSFATGKPSGQTIILNERVIHKEFRQLLINVASQFKVLSTPTATSGR